MPIPPTLLAAIVDAAGAHLASIAASHSPAPNPFPIHPEDAAQALRVEAREALARIDLKEVIADEIGSAADLAELLREEVARVVEHEVDVDRAFDEVVDDIERDLRRQSESIDLEELARDVIAEAKSDEEIRAELEAAMSVALTDAHALAVRAAGEVLAAHVVESAERAAESEAAAAAPAVAP